ncbi:site-specific DNA-methyltransferase [Riemerella anatipestifer]|uniref:site-specific DNA-methyltransferase n=1 Tax=Riemerella anatipestifer TaxID=34085 RepID=UPI001C6E40C4|nr:site-specific DNA-methyltransferase [Riemerella anatipestifer]QYQ96866.1 site-specific DNA-methyltransferase [Riemerella anatipestifer]
MSIEKLDLQSPDLVNENFEKLANLFPNCVTEGENGKAIDFDLLKKELSHQVIEGNRERYRLEWPGKREAIVTANLPTTKTLRPVREDSVDFDNTENLYIEGDNLEVLKLLQESYLGKIKMIYIDPPYNTGNDFVYKDNFSKDAQEELLESGQKDEYNQRLVANPETAGRYHSDWLSMMYPRLKLARNLLTDDGVIFISIDDNEVHNLRKICDDIFGDIQFESQIIPIVNPGGRDYKQVAITNEYVLLYSKSDELVLNEMPKEVDFKFYDSKGGYILRELRNRNPKFHSGNRPNLFYPFFIDPNNKQDGYCTVSLEKDSKHTVEAKPYNSKGKESVWRWGKEKAFKAIVSGNHDKSQILAKQKSDGNWNIYEKNRRSTTKVKSVWSETEMRTENGTRLIRELFDATPFDHPKSIDLIKRCVLIGTNEGDLILDFFSGSATTAHAVMQLNAEDGGNRKHIQVQLPEAIEENSEAYKAGYTNICELGKERIRRAAKKIKEETGADIDYGFRVYRLDSSNMQDVYYKPQDYDQSQLDLFADNVKPDRTADDLLAQVMLDWGLPLSLKIETEEVLSKKVFKVAENSLYACFDKGIDEDFTKAIAKDKPLRIVFKDSSFKNDTAKTNVKQLLKQLSPETEMKVI